MNKPCARHGPGSRNQLPRSSPELSQSIPVAHFAGDQSLNIAGSLLYRGVGRVRDHIHLVFKLACGRPAVDADDPFPRQDGPAREFVRRRPVKPSGRASRKDNRLVVRSKTESWCVNLEEYEVILWKLEMRMSAISLIFHTVPSCDNDTGIQRRFVLPVSQALIAASTVKRSCPCKVLTGCCGLVWHAVKPSVARIIAICVIFIFALPGIVRASVASIAAPPASE